MRSSILLAGLALAASAVAQAVSEGIAPSATAPAGCKPTYAGNFTINAVDIKFGVQKATAPILPSAVTMTLKDGILHDSLGRTGAIVANHQFQFDGPPQAGSIYTGGFSACANSSLALGGSAIFYACTSGAFRNLYDENVGDQCSPINIVIVPVGKTAEASTSSSSSSVASSTKSSSASKTESKSSSGSASASVASGLLTTFVSGNGTASATFTSAVSISTNGLAVTTDTSATAAGTSAAGSAAAASSTASTGAAVATFAAARGILGAAVGAFGAAVILF